MPKPKKSPAEKPPAGPEAITSAIYEVVAAIPRGAVATYGQVAELAGLTNGHRRVARAMRFCPKGLPWQRVVGRKDSRRAQINILDPENAARQRALLKAEKVNIDEDGFIALRRFGWLPVD
jgi:methylated-DNA-protein-cysteine methyltransferase-like protein